MVYSIPIIRRQRKIRCFFVYRLAAFTPVNPISVDLSGKLLARCRIRVKPVLNISPLKPGSLYCIQAFSCQFFRLVPPVVDVVRYCLITILTDDEEWGIINLHVVGGSFHAGIVDKCAEIPPACTVICSQKFIHMLIIFRRAHIRIHHQLCQQIASQFSEFSGHGRIEISFRIHPLCNMFRKEAHIFPQYRKIRERGQIMRVVRHIIPNVQPVTYLAPVLNILHKIPIMGTAQVV